MFVGVGNPVYDFIKTPQITTGERVLSGCSTNACLVVSKLGQDAALVGCVGEDFEERFVADMERYNIEYQLYPAEETGGFSLIYDARGDRTLDVLGVAPPVPAFPLRFGNASFILLGPILGEVTLELVQSIRAVTRSPIILDPQGMMRSMKDDGRIERFKNPEFEEVISMCNVVKANEHEAHVLTGIYPRDGETEAREAAKAIHAMGCEIAIVTLADDGSVIYDGSEMIRIPAYATNALDPTGAGDTYAGGFMVRYTEDKYDLREVGYFASCVASVMVENTGPDFPLTYEEAERRTAELLKKQG
jgi:sugar/nucleoside kinase (ribokinase family)